MITALRDAEPEHKLKVYRNLGLHLTYDAETQTVQAKNDLGLHRWDRSVSEDRHLPDAYAIPLTGLLIPAAFPAGNTDPGAG